MKSFEKKFFLGILVFVLLILPVVGYSMYSLWQVVEAQNKLASTYAEELLLAKDLRRETFEKSRAIRGYILNGLDVDLNEFRQANQEFLKTSQELQPLYSQPKDQQRLAELIDLENKNYDLATGGIQMKEQHQPVVAVSSYFLDHTRPNAARVGALLGQILDETTQAYESAKRDAELTSRKVLTHLGLASTVAALLSLLTAALLLKLLRQKKDFDTTNDLLAARERELSKARKETVEVVAHDLKSPLASIIMGTQLALDRDPASDKSAEDVAAGLQITLRSAESMRRLIDDLLDHAKIESGNLSLSKTRCEIHALLMDITSRFLLLAENKNIQLRCQFAPHLPQVAIDKDRIEQVVSNLMTNALKFTPTGGEIVLNTEMRGGDIVISVADTGRGMTAEQSTHVFERYWQVRQTASQGIGLGLSISKSIVQAHGGKIWVESDLGKGSIFYISIPVGFVENMKPQLDLHFL